MNRTFQRAAIAAAVLIATLGTFTWWSTQHGIAFADVVRAIDTVRSMRCTATIQGAGAVPIAMTVTVLDHRVRQEIGGAITSVIDVGQEQILTLLPEQKRAIFFQMPGLADAGESSRNLLSMLRERLHGAGGKAEDLGWRQIGGRQARGFRANDEGLIVTLWADPDTALPLEVELPWGDGQTTILITDYEYNPALDESLFAMTPPPGYTLLQATMNLKDTTEQDLVSLLNLLADANDGCFPETLALGSLQYDMGQAQSQLSGWQQYQLGGSLARALTFIRNCRDPKYLGAGVSKGEFDRPVYWYRPKDSQVYRVIYGDLTVRELPAGQLPKIEMPAAAAPHAAPLVIETVPAADAMDVDPATEIRITFDQNMRRRGYIHLESAEPKRHSSNELKVTWLDARTCLLPVELKGHSLYVIRLSKWGNTNEFPRSAAGQVAQPWQMTFTTGPAAGEEALTPEQNRAAIETLRDTLHQEYPHILNGFDIDGRMAEYASQVESCKGKASFALLLQKVLADLQAPRIQIWYSQGQSLWSSGSGARHNVSWALLPQVVPNWEQKSRPSNVVHAGRFPGGVSYIHLQTWQDKTCVLKTITELADSKALILDLRSCGGASSITTVEAVACRFIDQPVLYGRETPRNASAAAAGEPAKELRLEPDPAASHVAARLVVLVGPQTGHSSEQLALMLKQAPGCTLIGEKTAGLFGSDESLDLDNGVRVTLPKYGVTLPDGTDVADGVQPDIQVPVTQADFDAGRDPVLETALKLLQE